MAETSASYLVTGGAPPPSTRDISSIMRAVHSADTEPERVLRDALAAAGIESETNIASLPGKPDLILRACHVALFIDGDYWHGNQWRRRKLATLEHQFRETPSRLYWLRKIRTNMERDCRVTRELLQQGWTVARFWESDIKEDVEGCVATVLEVIREGPAEPGYGHPGVPDKTVAEFFAGIGLMRMGLEGHGWRVIFANDIDADKHEMYRGHFPDAAEHFVIGDIHRIPVENVPTVTLATASFPCNDLSLAGARLGLLGSQSGAFWGFIRILDELENRRPPLVLLENVTGFLTSNGGADFQDALLALNHLGYSVDAFILDAAAFVPQSRPRLFVVGVMGEPCSREEVRETLAMCGSEARPKALAQFIFTHPGIRWALRPLPAPPLRELVLEDILEALSEHAPEWWSETRATYLLSQMSPKHRAIADRMIGGNGWSYGTVFRRVRKGKSMAELRTDGVAGCLRTPRGGSGRQILFKGGDGHYFARLLTPRECARLMGADDFKITATANQALFGFGDAVCVRVIEWIAQNYLNPVVNEMLRGSAFLPANPRTLIREA
ncbi:MAG: DNA-cytosine methyltransferase [Chloroflexi bacterium]|nr:DNA-cytosine methyltransferase [Chloroflexota bacterium]